ncbi:zinc finger CCCH domain-containing protein [Trifolium repens]|nr:zinc finger CCCH domain-containing protein [Trifolium repens]
MREEREWAEKGRKTGAVKPKGYVHRLDQVATSFFITNFPEDVNAADLWPKFARFGRVGEVYIPDRLDKQGRRFGFVKYRDIRDAREQLDLISNIWVCSFKLRVNLSRFEKGASGKGGTEQVAGKEKGLAVTSQGVTEERAVRRSFKDVLDERPPARSIEKERMTTEDGRKGCSEVVWEVEVEADALAKLKGSFVGFLNDPKEPLDIQRSFVMDGYLHIKVMPLGHKMVLLSSSVDGEVKDIVRVVGWWCTCFEKFEEWSPECTSSRRDTWLNCYGVPLHAWGEALFRSLGFKFGSYVETDENTKKMLRGDVAKIRITTDSPSLIDSSISVMVLEKKFVIRVLEDPGGGVASGRRCGKRCEVDDEEQSCIGSGDGRSVAAVVGGESEEGGDSDWSESREGVLGLEVQKERKGVDNTLRLECDKDKGVSGGDPIFLGTTLCNSDRVNALTVDNEEEVREQCRALVVIPAETEGILVDVSGSACHARVEGHGVGSEACNQIVDNGPHLFQPNFLRTKEGDIPFVFQEGGVVSGSVTKITVSSLGSGGNKVIGPQVNSSVVGVQKSLPYVNNNQAGAVRSKRGRTKKVVKRPNPNLPGNKFARYKELSKGSRKSKRKKADCVIQKNQMACSSESDPIVSCGAEASAFQQQQYSDFEGIRLEVVLPQSCGDRSCPEDHVEPRLVASCGGGGDSGLGALIEEVAPICSNLPFSGGLIDKDRGDAYHIIDIQEELGMNFKGEGEEDVDRCVLYEGRDRQRKND